MSNNNLTIKSSKPKFPSSRYSYERLIFGLFYFEDREEFEEWKKEPLWRRLFGKTRYDKKNK